MDSRPEEAGFEPSVPVKEERKSGRGRSLSQNAKSNPAVPSVPIGRWATAAAPGEVRLEWQSLLDAFLRRSGWDLSRLLPRWVVEHKTSGDRRCRDETAFIPAKQAIPVARDPVIAQSRARRQERGSWRRI